MNTQTCRPTQSRACLRRQHACLHETVFWKLLEVFRPLCPLARARVCVCVRRVVTYSGHFLLRYSHGTFFCNLLNALHRLRPLTCVCSTPAWLHLRTFRSLLLQHIPSHTSVLSPTPTSAHAFTVTIMKFLFLISENNAVHQVSRLVIPGNAGYPG